jgi:hypothetical protein
MSCHAASIGVVPCHVLIKAPTAKIRNVHKACGKAFFSVTFKLLSYNASSNRTKASCLLSLLPHIDRYL